MSDAVDILQKIADVNRVGLEQRKQEVPEAELLRKTELVPPAKSLYASLKSKDGIRIISELKKASPSSKKPLRPKDSSAPISGSKNSPWNICRPARRPSPC